MSDHVGFARVFIELINENDNRPIFSKPLYNISLPENTAPGTSLLRILVSALKHPCRVCCDLFLKFRLRVFHWVCFTVGVFFTCLWAYSVSIQVLIMDDSLNYQDSQVYQCWSCGLVLKYFLLPIIRAHFSESKGCVLPSCLIDRHTVVKKP